MKSITLESYAEIIKATSINDFKSNSIPNDLLICTEGKYQTFYAPFDYINVDAKVVIVGITPGLQQASNALIKAREVLLETGSIEEAKKQAKVYGSFSGPMRKNLTEMLDNIGLSELVGIRSTEDLFEEESHLVNFTSAIRYPVFENGKNFNDKPIKLKEQLLAWFAEECEVLNDAIYIPLGPKVSEALEYVVQLGKLSPEQVLTGLPHPSGSNIERIKYFLGKKDKKDLSSKTNPDILDAAKYELMQKISVMRGRFSHQF